MHHNTTNHIHDPRPMVRISIDTWSPNHLRRTFEHFRSKTGLVAGIDFETTLDDGTPVDIHDATDVMAKSEGLPCLNHVRLRMVFEHGRDADAILECCAGHPSTRRRNPSTDVAG